MNNCEPTLSRQRTTGVVLLGLVLMVIGAPGRTRADAGASVDSLIELEKRIVTRSTMRSVENATVQWQTESDIPCPSSLAALVEKKILNRPPLDAWGREFDFACPSQHGNDVDLVSLGKDGKKGTADDIRSWEEEKGTRVEAVLTPSLFLLLEHWRLSQGLESRSDAIQKLVGAGLRMKAIEESRKDADRRKMAQ